MTRLGIYIVPSKRSSDGHDFLTLVVAESAAQAADTVAFQPDQPFEQTETPGRLGDYEPGFEGHNLVVTRPRLIIREDVTHD